MLNDLAMGVRLAVGGGRNSRTTLVRLVLGTVGVGLAVWVLLVAAAIQPAMQAQSERVSARTPVNHEQLPGVDALEVARSATSFHGVLIERNFVRATGPNTPRMPGVDRLPGPGESVVSPALAKLLASPGSALLKPRLSEPIVGTIGQAGLSQPQELLAIIGTDTKFDQAVPAYRFGVPDLHSELPTQLVIILVVGLVTLLIPVFIFVASSARVAGAERDRRLAALRLVGAGARQVRRIAAAESLVSTVFGLLLGGGLFLLLRSSSADIVVANENFFPSDLTPPAWLVGSILVGVPVLALMTTQLALRSTVIEPLGVVRQAKPVTRRMLWRLVVIAVGVALLLVTDGEMADDTIEMLKIIGGSTLLLVGVPTLLPWVLERVVARFRGGGGPSFQLAMRRLQLDPGTPARVVGGLAVVLAGAVALQMVLMGQLNRFGAPPEGARDIDMSNMVFVDGPGKVPDDLPAAWAKVPGVTKTYAVSTLMATTGNDPGAVDAIIPITVADCANLRQAAAVSECADGDAFMAQGQDLIHPGAVLHLLNSAEPFDSYRTRPFTGTLRLPLAIQRISIGPDSYAFGGVLLTPGAVNASAPLDYRTAGVVVTDRANADAQEEVLNVADRHRDRLKVGRPGLVTLNDTAQMFLDLRKGLLTGSLFTLLVASVSLLVVALEQMRERRRAIAALSATGVPTSTLVRSLLWQNAIPMFVALVLAVATGVGLGLLVFRLMGLGFVVDWSTIGVMAATAAGLILVITTLTLPTLKSATHLNALRTE
ncbi:FtsX-like permease family protein [Actinocrispum sp. NPDC049592]|uniref:FtsX-like permease family protein n=1 Tax=Actinocrispum sp. NPDC049592 TaxID=3154835 RepID=UPI0034269966